MSENIQVPQGWEVKKLGEVFKKVTEKNIHLKINTVLTNSAQFGVIPQNEFFDKSIATKENIDNYYILEMDNFIYNPRISKLAPAGPISRNKYGIGCVSPLYTVFKIHSNNNINFYEFYFKSNLWNRQAYNIANFGARFDRMNITDKDFFNMPIPVPPLEEQKKIAEILSLWDKAIEQTKELIAYKEKQKKGLMQALLTGKKRLNGFTDKWKTIKLGECFKFLRGEGLSKEMLDNNGKNYCILYGELYTTYSEVISDIVSKTNYTTSILSKNGDVLIPCSTTTKAIDLATASSIKIDNILIGGDINILRPTIDINSDFIAYYITNIIKKKIATYAQGTTIIHLYGKDIKPIKIKIPTINEQNLIINIIKNADEEIQLLNKQLELYTEQKKGLMQNLLTGKVRV